MSQVTVNDINYRTGKMTPREQLHVLRRIGPLIAGVAPAVMALLDGTKDKAEVMADLMGSIGPVSELLARMSDEDVDYIMNACMARVEREQKGQWFPVYTMAGGRPMAMYQDTDLMTELRLASAVVQENLQGFIAALSGGGASSLSASLSGAVRS